MTQEATVGISDQLKKAIDDLELERRLDEAGKDIDQTARNAVQSVGGYVSARQDHIDDLIERTAGKVDQRFEGKYADQVAKVVAGLHAGVAMLADQADAEAEAASDDRPDGPEAELSPPTTPTTPTSPTSPEA